jgi:hypothetical protein
MRSPRPARHREKKPEYYSGCHIYSEKLQLTIANTGDVTAAADFFRLENVILVCDKFLSENGNCSVLTPGLVLSL